MSENYVIGDLLLLLLPFVNFLDVNNGRNLKTNRQTNRVHAADEMDNNDLSYTNNTSAHSETLTLIDVDKSRHK